MIESGPQPGAPRAGRPVRPRASAAAEGSAPADAQPAAAPSAAPPAGQSAGQPAAPPAVDPTAVAAWVTAYQPEDGALLSARRRAREFGVRAVPEATGAALRMLAAMSGARHAVELGTGAGVATLWLLRGLPADGVLTSIDNEPEHQRLAKLSLAEEGVRSGRVRLIAGRALEVLPRLSDGGYDLVVCDASSPEAVDYLPAALRLLRDGGVVAFMAALAGGRVADPSAREPEVLAARELARAVRDEPRLLAAVLPVGSGLLVGVKQDVPVACP